MNVTVEMSLYPLQKKYKKIIKAFIKELKKDKKIKVKTNAMSSYITGDYDSVMVAILTDLKVVFEEVPNAVSIIKIIPQNLDIEKGFIKI